MRCAATARPLAALCEVGSISCHRSVPRLHGRCTPSGTTLDRRGSTMLRLMSGGLWDEVGAKSRRASVRRAAIAYVGSSPPIRFGKGDLLVVDASDASITAGRTRRVGCGGDCAGEAHQRGSQGVQAVPDGPCPLHTGTPPLPTVVLAPCRPLHPQGLAPF